jgi:hypothetical protein
MEAPVVLAASVGSLAHIGFHRMREQAVIAWLSALRTYETGRMLDRH